MKAIDSADEGWKITLLLRLSPLMPYALINYLLSSTQLGLFTYTWCTALGVLPPTALYVYLGTTAAKLSDILGDAFESPSSEEPTAPAIPLGPVAAPSAMDTTQLWVMGIGVVITVAVAVLVTVFTSRAIKRASSRGTGSTSAITTLEEAMMEGSSASDDDNNVAVNALSVLDRLDEDDENSVQLKDLSGLSDRLSLRSDLARSRSLNSSGINSETEFLDNNSSNPSSPQGPRSLANSGRSESDSDDEGSRGSTNSSTPFTFTHSPTAPRLSTADHQGAPV